ncbi:plasmid partitioning protein [Streptomyces ruber]|uniref:Plasmid partitioning protein n=2 Tax=Streptomyces TaxID=1883 RepID=A0A918BK34_9ACTN|nr:ParB/RepB/Spo0J family partition protein [Streptomyces ruber]GGQ72173.1 plasmid partitioning protein [Streptomyces ruber]
MSKADRLGAGRFGAAARPVSARRAAIGAATGVPTEGVAPPTRLPVHRISLNPDNPRTSLGDLTELAGSLKEHGQKQAITVMNRDAYLTANPEREPELEPDTTHVVVDGSSRLAAAREAGLPHINVMVDDDQGADGEAILESALVANVHRQDLEPLDEARALQRLLAIHGTQTKLAKRLHKSQGWVSQRLALLNLTSDLQERIGQEPIDLLRAVANKPAEQQQTALEGLKADRSRKEAAKQESRSKKPRVPVERGGEADVADSEYYGVIENGSASASAEPVDAEVEEAHAGPTETVPEPRTSGRTHSDTGSGEPGPRALSKLPYDDGAFLAMHLIRKMSDTEFDKMLLILNEHQNKRATTSAADA